MNLRRFYPAFLAAAIALPAIAQTGRPGPNRKPREAELSQAQISYIRPGVKVKVISAGIAKDGTISMSFICAYITAGQKQYTSYSTTVLKATLNNNPSQTQAANDSGGVITNNADGDYTYTFKTKAPANFEAGSTHSIGVSANRN